jgi:hypothetical protein
VDAIISSSGGCSARDHDVERRFAHFVGQREAVAGRLHASAVGAGSGIGQFARNARFHQRELAARHAFAIERHSGLQRMRDIVRNLDVVAEQLFAQAIGEKAAAIGYGGGAEVAEHLSHQIQHRRRLQISRCSGRGDFGGIDGQARFFGGAACQR